MDLLGPKQKIIVAPQTQKQSLPNSSYFEIYQALISELKHEVVSYLFLDVSTQERKKQAIEKFVKMPIYDALERYTAFKNRKSFKPYLTNLSVPYQKKRFGKVYLPNLRASFHPLEFFIFSDKELACAGKNGTFSLDDFSHMKSIQSKGMDIYKRYVVISTSLKALEEFFGIKHSNDHSPSGHIIKKNTTTLEALVWYDELYQYRQSLKMLDARSFEIEKSKIETVFSVVNKILDKKKKRLNLSDINVIHNQFFWDLCKKINIEIDKKLLIYPEIFQKEIEEFLGYKKSDDPNISDLFIGK